MLARYEGDEFVIFGYDCTLQLIQEIKKNIKDAVEEWNRIETQTVDVTFGFIKGTKGYFNSFELLIDFELQYFSLIQIQLVSIMFHILYLNYYYYIFQSFYQL